MDVNFFPAQLTSLNIEEDLREMMSETGDIFHETGMPMFPCLLHHFCLPFSPICAVAYCMSQRKSRLEELIKDFNQKKGKQKKAREDLKHI
jgi:hypothetical protein